MIDPFANQTLNIFEIHDDAYIRWFLAQHKLLGAFSAGPFSKPTGQYRRFFGHPTHWLVICRFDCHANPADDGYVIHCLSKSDYTREDLDSYYATVQRLHSDGSGDVRSFRPRPERN